MNYYPEQLEAILFWLKHLNEGDKQLEKFGEGALFLKPIGLTDGDSADWGTLRDEIGGAWSWFPPEKP